MAIPPEIPLPWIAVKDMIIKQHNMTPYMSWGKIRPAYKKLVPEWGFTGIAIHHSGNSSSMQCPTCIEKEHRNRNPANDHVGYHYLIDRKGEYFEGRPIVYKGEHLALANTGRIGICLLGDYDHQFYDDDDDLSKPQLASVDSLIATLIKHFPIKYLGGHKEYMNHKKPNNYTCPGNVLMPEVVKFRKRYNLNAP